MYSSNQHRAGLTVYTLDEFTIFIVTDLCLRVRINEYINFIQNNVTYFIRLFKVRTFSAIHIIYIYLIDIVE